MNHLEPIKVSVDGEVLPRILQQHFLNGSNVEVGGLLIGRYEEEQPPGACSVSIDDILPVGRSRIGFDWETTEEEWALARKKVNERARLIVGWYHTHLGQGAFMSQMDIQIHQTFFDQRSNVALVVDPLQSTWRAFVWSEGQIVPISQGQIDARGNYAMPESHVDGIDIVFETTMNAQAWDMTIPRDVPIEALIARLIREPDLAIKAFDEHGNAIKYRIIWKEGNRQLGGSETIRAAGVLGGQTLVMDYLQRAPALELARPLRVFICHASDDKPAVRKLYRQLSIEDLDTWLDEERLLPGQDWQFEIEKAVRICDIVLVCLSRSSINKAGYIQKEIKQALDIADQQPEGTIFIIPLKLEECEVPDRLRRWQWLNLSDVGGFERLMRAFLRRASTLGITADESFRNA